MSDLVERLRALSRAEHDDLSIGAEAADEIERLRALTEWRPIETAPKGTQVILCGDYSTDLTIARWDGTHWRCMADGYDAVEYMSDFGTEYRTFEVPSHWLPLPPPPVQP